MMLSTTGVRLYHWYEMGITEYEDLQWCLEFYSTQKWPLSIIGSALAEAKRYILNRDM